MVNSEKLINYCCSKPKAYIDYPFGDQPICIKVKKKIFAQVFTSENNYKITLKCEKLLADFFRQQYPGVVVRGYHCPGVQQPYWNTVYIDKIEETVLFTMIDHAYEQVIKGFSKKVQREILSEANSTSI